ncbi:uncharacterized protein LOC126795108 [Argentina anserina]|uniref:uncharacterized protein LOC126795108 n=1 Tax=Argentina anserina TaxID=57926 RepID=UPI002176901A|nr:uncharacterized protein LOC126795108 [Potentilla anserina]
MAFRKWPDEAVSISVLVSKLRDAHRSSSKIDEVEEKLIVREMRIKKEYDKQKKEWEEKLKSEREEGRVWKGKYEKLLDKAKRRGIDADENLVPIIERKNNIFHTEKMKMLRDLESAVSRLEDENGELMKCLGINFTGKSDNGTGSEESAPVLELENGFDDLNVNEGSTDPKKSPGIGNVGSDAIVIIDNDRESAGQTLSGKKNSKNDEGNGILNVAAGVPKDPHMLKRKRAPSPPSIGNNENDDEDFALDHIPISEVIRKQGKKLSLGLSSSQVTGKDASLGFCDPMILRQSGEKERKKQKSLPKSSKSHAKASNHTFGNHGTNDETSSDSSQDTEYEKSLKMINDVIQRVKQ